MSAADDRLDNSTEDSRSSALKGLIKANRLDYVIPKSLNVAVNTQWSEHVSSGRSQYGVGDCIQISLNTGEAYVAPRCASLVFDVQTSAAGNFGNSAIDLIKQIKICTHSGTQAYSGNNIASRVQTTDGFELDESQLLTVGSLYGHNDGTLTGSVASQNLIVKTRFVIPLYKVCGLFDSSKLMPNLLAQGLKLDIQIEPNASKAIKWDAGVGTVTITDPKILIQTVQLSDSVLRQISKTASSKGLEYMYHQFEDVSSSTTSTKIVLDSKRALSRTVNVFTKVKPTTVVATDNSYVSAPFDTANWSFMYGGLSMPSGCGAGSDIESYFYALHSNEKSQDMRRDCSVSLADFKGTGPKSFASHWVSLERSHVVALSGRPISVGNLLTFIGTLNTAVPAGLDVEMYVKYVSVLNLSLTKSVLKI